MASFDINAVARRVQHTVGSSDRDGPYAFSFQVNSATELAVYQNDTLRTEGTHYNSSIGATGAGTITFAGGSYTPTAADVITIIGDQPLSRTTNFQTGQVNQPATLETEFDNVLIRQQQLQEITDRSIQLKPSTGRTVTGSGTSGPLQFPYDSTVANNANRLVKFDSNGTALELGSTTTNIDTLAGKATEIGLLGTSANVTAMGLLGTSAVVADMALLATTDAISDMAILATSDIVSDLNTLATSAIVADLAILATSDIVSDINTLATSDIVSDLNTLATSAIVADLAILATSDIVTDINLLATSDVVSDLNTLATSDFVSDLNTLASSTVVTNIATVAANVAGVNSFAARYRVTGGDPGSDNDAGDLNYNTSSNALKYWNGSAWTTIASSYSIDTATDTNLTSVADGAMLLYDTGTSKWIDNVMSGDATMADTGAITIANDRIDSQHYVAASIDNEHLADNAVGTDEIANDAVTYAKMQNVSATDRILGRDSASAGVIEEITPANLRTMINVADGSNAYVHPNHTGEVTSTADGATVIADNIVDEANLKVSNAPTNGYMLTAQSGDTGGLTWAEAGGGATTLISTVTTSSNGGTIEIATAGYNSYILDIGNWRHTGGGTEKLHCTLKRSGESSYDSSYGYGVINLQTAAVLIDTTGAANIVLNGGIRKGDSGSTRLALNNFGTDALQSSVFGQTVQSTNGHAASHTDTVQVFSAGGAIDDADSGDVITHILLGLSGDEFPAGIVYRLYGIT